LPGDVHVHYHNEVLLSLKDKNAIWGEKRGPNAARKGHRRFSLHRKHSEKTVTIVATAYNTPLWIMQPVQSSLQFAGKKG